MTNQTALETLTAALRVKGPIPTVRVSSAQARGAAKQYNYWGAVRYEIRLTKQGVPANVALERASSDRRVYHLATADAERMAEEEDRVECQCIGRLSEQDAAYILLCRPDLTD